MVMRRATPKAISERNDVDREEPNDAGADFISVQLELADTFCKLALESRSPEGARQHQLGARRAMDAAFNALIKVHMSKTEIEGIVTRIEEVKALLESLEAGGSTHPSC
jgi:hypothetical protein